ncbi:MAG: hypothetical protein M0P93_09025 [Candidatus Cloacimonetes bacterium]|nr:hypothetical protein [Candidatus Cloacimonadota bacterium]
MKRSTFRALQARRLQSSREEVLKVSNSSALQARRLQSSREEVLKDFSWRF